MRNPVQLVMCGQATVPGVVFDRERVVSSRRIMQRLNERVPRPGAAPCPEVRATHCRLARSRSMRRALCLFLLALLMVPASASATRTAVLITGDSIVESAQVRREAGGYDGLGARLQVALANRNVRMGGYGFIPTHDARAELDIAAGLSPTPWSYTGPWSYRGLLFFPSLKSEFGPDGMPAVGASGARAQLTLTGNRVGLSYATTPGGASLQVSIDGRLAGTVATAGRAGSGLRWFPTTDASHLVTVTVVGPGEAILQGLVATRSLTNTPEIEIDQIGHGGNRAQDDFGPAQQDALLDLSPRLTVIMFGTNEELFETSLHDLGSRDKLTRGLTARGKLARKTGSCVVVWHAPNTVAASVQQGFRKAAQKGARLGGCSFATPLDGLWTAESSQRDKLTVNGIHPTAAGYDLMAAKLARLLVTLSPVKSAMLSARG